MANYSCKSWIVFSLFILVLFPTLVPTGAGGGGGGVLSWLHSIRSLKCWDPLLFWGKKKANNKKNQNQKQSLQIFFVLLWAYLFCLPDHLFLVMDWEMGDGRCCVQTPRQHSQFFFSCWITQVQSTNLTTESPSCQIKSSTCISNNYTSQQQVLWAVNTEGYYSVWFTIYSKYLIIFFLPWITTPYNKTAAISSVSYKWVFSLTLLESKPHTPQKSKILLTQFTWHSDITVKYKLRTHKPSCYHAE